MKYLIVVESPAKKKPIEKYLGKDYEVRASFGHVRDLPSKNGSVLPDQDFSMKYEINLKSKKHIDEIVEAAKKAEIIYLAMDPDREGEAIAWHIAEILKEKKVIKSLDSVQRIAFNEITKKAITQAINNPRKIDYNLVDAQQARRALDYLVGFTLSPVLWRKLPGCKSAGRVQSVALRLICEKEDGIERFKTQEYWDISFGFLNAKKEPFPAKLTYANKVKLEKFSITNSEQANILSEALSEQNFIVQEIQKKQQKRYPPAPFITSSLQQEASRKLGFSAKKTMQVAQKLYEGIDLDGESIGLITYMRTDGTTISSEAISAIRNLIPDNYGDEYLPSAPRIYKSKVKNAQEAHEAIRPTDVSLNPEMLKNKMEDDYFKLYELIWKRTVACQMENALLDIVVANLSTQDNNYGARATGSIIAFDGFYRVYKEGIDDEKEEENRLLPVLSEGEKVKTEQIKPLQHFTEPQPRYSESSLVKKLEELGIGRPSTYASTLSVLQERNYVSLDKKRFVPEELGRLVTAFLTGFFEKYVEYNFTASLETDLDQVAEGNLEWKRLLQKFWQDFNQNIIKTGECDIVDVISYVEGALEYHLFGESSAAKKCHKCDTGKLNLKLGKFGAFLGCSNYPECNFRKSITSDQADESNTQTYNEETKDKLLGQTEEGDVYLRKGPYGPYIQLGEQISKSEKPKRAPLPGSIAQNDLTLDLAVKLLSLPYSLGKYKSTKEEIMLGIGKFGPYLKYAGKFISIPKSLDPFSLSIEDAVEIINSTKLKDKKTIDSTKSKDKKTVDSTKSKDKKTVDSTKLKDKKTVDSTKLKDKKTVDSTKLKDKKTSSARKE
ncbi:MAG: type I DNA topoisomerase [Janthinobacterium lividum]